AYSDLIPPVFTLGFAGVRRFPSCARQHWNGSVMALFLRGAGRRITLLATVATVGEIDGDDGDSGWEICNGRWMVRLFRFCSVTLISFN
ncbi:hypothetical protein Dimus_001398, partial [Dionaea muscipula]